MCKPLEIIGNVWRPIPIDISSLNKFLSWVWINGLEPCPNDTGSMQRRCFIHIYKFTGSNRSSLPFFTLLMLSAAFSFGGWWWGDELYPAAVCKGHWWGEKGYRTGDSLAIKAICSCFFWALNPNTFLLSPPRTLTHTHTHLFSWVLVKLSSQPSLLMLWCSRSLSLKKET